MTDAATNLRPIKVLVFMEAKTVTGPAKNLIEFARLTATPGAFHSTTQVVFATYQRGDTSQPNAFVQAVRDAGLLAEVIPEKRVFDTSVLDAMRALLAKHQPDLVQTHSVKSHFLACLAGVPRKFPWIAFHHGYTRTDLKDVLYNQLNRWSLRKASRVVTVCEAFAAELRRTGVAAERLTVRHNMVKLFVPANSEQVAALRAKHSIPANALVGICVGRLSQEKRQIDLVRALAHLKRRALATDYRIVIVGDGPERSRLEAEAVKLDVGEKLVFAGFQADTAPYYSMADFAVLPSHSEGSPNALLEAMAVGLPAVCTRVGGVPEIVEDGESAILLQRKDPAALAAGMERVLTDSLLRKRMGVAAQKIAGRYSSTEYCAAILAIYREVLEAAGAKRGGAAAVSAR